LNQNLDSNIDKLLLQRRERRNPLRDLFFRGKQQ